MKLLYTAAALALLTTFVTTDPAKAFGVSGTALALKNTSASSVFKTGAPPSNYQGQWYTTPDGCSYSRAQAPGYPPTWHLIINPHHIGQPNAKRGCAAML